MTDYAELKRLAEAAKDDPSSPYIPCQVGFQNAATPEVVLALIAENECLRADLREVKDAKLGLSWAIGEVMGECDRFKAENEALRKDADRLQSATAFVQKLCDSAGKQPSVATGYLHDILSAMSKGEQS